MCLSKSDVFMLSVQLGSVSSAKGDVRNTSSCFLSNKCLKLKCKMMLRAAFQNFSFVLKIPCMVRTPVLFMTLNRRNQENLITSHII